MAQAPRLRSGVTSSTFEIDQDDRRNIDTGQRQTDARNASVRSANARAIESLRRRTGLIDRREPTFAQGMTGAGVPTRVAESADTARFGNAVINQAHREGRGFGVRSLQTAHATRRGATPSVRLGTTHAERSSAVDENVRVKERQEHRMRRATLRGNVSATRSSAANRHERDVGDRSIVASAAEAAGGRDFAIDCRPQHSSPDSRAGPTRRKPTCSAASRDSMEGGGATNRAERSRRSRIAARDRETRRQAREQSPLGRFWALFGIERDDTGNIKPLDGLQTGPRSRSPHSRRSRVGSRSCGRRSRTAARRLATRSRLSAQRRSRRFGNVAIQEGSAMLFKAIPAMIEEARRSAQRTSPVALG